MLTQRSRGKETITTALVTGSMLMTMIVSLRLPSTGSSSRWSIPSRRMLTRLLPVQAGNSVSRGISMAGAAVGGGPGGSGGGTTTASWRLGTVMLEPPGILTCVVWNCSRSFQLDRNSQPNQNPPRMKVVTAQDSATWRSLMSGPRLGGGGGGILN